MLFLVEMMSPEETYVRIGLIFPLAIDTLKYVWAGISLLDLQT